MRRKVLLVGDAVVSTGFARMNHAYADAMHAAGWEVWMIGINYTGDPHNYPYPIYPPYSYGGGEPWGMTRMAELARKMRPDMICVTNDPWNIPQYRKRAGNAQMMASVAVDGKNCRGNGLNGNAMTVFWTQFGLQQAQLGGFNGPNRVIPLGVDLEKYYQHDQATSRQGLPEDARDKFIVGVVGRNQPRKRIDLAMMYFAEWIRTRGISDAYLFLHIGPTGDKGYDVDQLAKYLKISNRVVVAEPPIGDGVTEKQMAKTYSCFDVMLSTTQGEGWGLTHMEAMACGVPCILPDWAALGEWAAPAAWMVECTSFACTPNNINAVGGLMDRELCLKALDQFYLHTDVRRRYREKGLELVKQPQYRWDAIGKAYVEAVEAGLQPETGRLIPFESRAPLAEASN